MHQGSVFSPPGFIIVLEALSREFREGLRMQDLFGWYKNGLFQSVLLKEVVIEPNVKLECVPKFLLFRRHTWCRRKCGGGTKSQSEMCLG